MIEPEAPTEHDEALQRLDRDLKRFKIDFERFFSGNLATPPDQLRQNIQKKIQYLRMERLRTVAQRFQLNTLEARFNTLWVKFNRRLREQEEGGGTTKAAVPKDTKIDTSQGILVAHSPDKKAVRALYDDLYGGSGRGKKTDFDSFRTYLEKQTAQIRSKTGCAQVRFRITSDGGELKLKAKPE
jgi:hypothetical protein